MGTFGYCAPEQIADFKRADARSDVYSLGRILYELHTGDSPAAPQDVAKLPVGISTIARRCTREDPEERFQTVTQLREAFALLALRRVEPDSEEQLQQLLGQLIAQKDPTREQIDQLTRLIPICADESTVLHELAVKMPGEAVEALYNANVDVTRILIARFAEIAISQGWPFAYTDQIGEACARIYYLAPDPEIRARVIATAVEVGVSHNRWHVMDLAAGMIRGTKDEADALAIAHALDELKNRLTAIAERLDVKKLHGHLRDVFESLEES